MEIKKIDNTEIGCLFEAILLLELDLCFFTSVNVTGGKGARIILSEKVKYSDDTPNAGSLSGHCCQHYLSLYKKTVTNSVKTTKKAVSRSPLHMASWPVTFFIQSNSLRLLYHAL